MTEVVNLETENGKSYLEPHVSHTIQVLLLAASIPLF
jgi:hypothetical protein